MEKVTSFQNRQEQNQQTRWVWRWSTSLSESQRTNRILHDKWWLHWIAKKLHNICITSLLWTSLQAKLETITDHPGYNYFKTTKSKSKAEKWVPHVKCQGWWLRCIDKIGTTTKRHLRLVAKMMLSQSVTIFWKCIISQNLQHFQRSIQAKWQSGKAQKGFPARQVTALVTIISVSVFL